MLPRIANSDPVVQEGVAAGTYPDLYVTAIHLKTPLDKPWRVAIHYCPYNYDTQELLETPMTYEVHRIPDLLALAAENETVSTALTAMLAAIVDQLPPPAPEEPEEPEAPLVD